MSYHCNVQYIKNTSQRTKYLLVKIKPKISTTHSKGLSKNNLFNWNWKLFIESIIDKAKD